MDSFLDFLQSQSISLEIDPQFMTSSNDLDRINCILRHSHVIDYQPNVDEAVSKCDKIAADFRAVGNNILLRRQWQLCLEKYTQALFSAQTAEEKALCHGNRSMALLEMGCLQDCLLEIERSIEIGFPKDRVVRLHLRACECLLRLQRLDDCSQRLELAKEFASRQPEVWQKKIDDISKRLETRRLINTSSESEQSLAKRINSYRPVIGQFEPDRSNPELPSASNAIEMRYTKEAGRGMFAKRDIELGEVLIIEAPYCSRLVPERFFTHCYSCHVACLALLPCSGCSKVGFCSQSCYQVAHSNQCQDNSTNCIEGVLGPCCWGHVWECPWMHLVAEPSSPSGLSKMAVLALATVARTTPEVVCHVVNKAMTSSTNNESAGGEPYRSCDYSSAYGIVANSESRTIKDLAQRTRLAVFLLLCLKKSGYLDQSDIDNSGQKDYATLGNWSREERSALIGAALLGHLQSLPCNAHDVAEQEITPAQPSVSSSVTCPERLELSSALYPTLSLANHSCDPNVVRVSAGLGDVCLLRALSPLPAGTQIMDNYSNHYATSLRLERQSVLNSQYFFSCACIPCRDNWPTFSGMSEKFSTPRYRCPSCHHDLPGVLNPVSPSCPACHNDFSTLWNSLIQCREVIGDHMTCILQYSPGYQELPTSSFASGDNIVDPVLEKIESSIRTHLNCLHALVNKPCIEFDQVNETLKMIWALQGNYRVKFVDVD